MSDITPLTGANQEDPPVLLVDILAVTGGTLYLAVLRTAYAENLLSVSQVYVPDVYGTNPAAGSTITLWSSASPNDPRSLIVNTLDISGGQLIITCTRTSRAGSLGTVAIEFVPTAVIAASWSINDGTITVADVATLTVIGGEVSGTSPDATLTVSGTVTLADLETVIGATPTVASAGLWRNGNVVSFGTITP